MVSACPGSARLSACERARPLSAQGEVRAPASRGEVAIKRGLGRDDFQRHPYALRRGLLDNGYREVPITSRHAVAVDGLPPLHRDPFDRILVAQALVEGITLLTADPLVAQYPGPMGRL